MTGLTKFDKRAFKESFGDTLLATPLNLFLNWFFLSIFLSMEMTPAEISIALTGMFFIMAVIRKYYVRVWFKSREGKRF